MMLKNDLAHETNEKIISLFKDELGGRIMKKFAWAKNMGILNG